MKFQYRAMKSVTWAAFSLCVASSAFEALAQAENTLAFYVDEIESIVQSRCIACHQSGGVAGGTRLLFTNSPTANNQAMLDYINSPALGSRGDTLLSKASGQVSHGGGTVLAPGTSDYNKLQQYVTLASTSPPPPSVFRAALEEPIAGEIHTGVGNLRGWAVATDGINKIEVFIDGGYVFDAPYGGQRDDVGGAFPDVIGADESGFSLAFNYSGLSAGEHTVRIEVSTDSGERESKQSTFTVVKFDSSFISDPNAVDLNAASCSVAGSEISISDGTVDGRLYDFILKWRVAEQGFEMIDVR